MQTVEANLKALDAKYLYFCQKHLKFQSGWQALILSQTLEILIKLVSFIDKQMIFIEHHLFIHKKNA